MGQQNGGYSRGDVRGDARSDVRGKQEDGSEDEIMREIEMARKERELLQNKKAEEQKGNEGPSSQQEAPSLNTNPSPNQNMRPNNGNPPRHFINNNSPRSDSEERWSRAKITPQPAVKTPTSPSTKNSDNTSDSNGDAITIKALIGPDRSLPKSSSNSPVKKDEAWKRSSSNDSESNPQPNRQKSNSINNSESNHSTPDVVKIMARPNNVSNNDSSTIVDNSNNKNNSDNDNTKKTPQGHYTQKQDTNDRGASNEHDQKYEQARALRMKESMERGPRTKGVLYRYNEKGEIERVFDRDDGGEVNVPFNQANTTKTILKKAPANV